MRDTSCELSLLLRERSLQLLKHLQQLQDLFQLMLTQGNLLRDFVKKGVWREPFIALG